jgi:uncharacterized protein YqeY
MLKNKIQTDFLKALKEKDTVAKMALNSVKAKITEAEKMNGNSEISESEIIKIITKAVKQREESMNIYSLADRPDLAANECLEIEVLMNYMPAQMPEDEIKASIDELLKGVPDTLPRNARIGKTMGLFNKQFQGKADSKVVLTIIESLV